MTFSMGCNEVIMDTLKYGNDDSKTKVGTITITVTVSGMINSDRMVLQNNGGDDLEVDDNGSYTFSNKLASGDSYNISISEMPSHHNCEVENGTGTVSNSNIDDVEIVCSEKEWVQDAYIKASNAGSGDNFGYSVAVDGNVIVVGATGEDSNTTGVTNGDGQDNTNDDGNADDSGAVYVFKKDSNGNWVQDAYIKASNAGGGDSFGYSVSISGDIIAVGATGEDSNITSIDNTDGSASSNDGVNDSGAVYVFKKDSSGNWIQDAYIKASNAGSGDNFGSSVAVDGDIIVVGAINEDSGETTIYNTDGSASTNESASNAGAVYVFKRGSNGQWIQDAYLKASNAGLGDSFGRSVSISGDIIVVGAYLEDTNTTNINNNDGHPTVAESNNDASDAGAVYIFKKDSNGNWIQDAYLKASNTEGSDNFGYSVSISGDMIVVGAVGEDSNVTSIDNIDGSASTNNDYNIAGAAYVFKIDSNGNWIQDAYLKASNAGAYDNYGNSVSISEDIIVVSAYFEGSNSTSIVNTDGEPNTDISGASSSGAVYVYKRDNDGNWIQDAYLKASNAGSGDNFGYSVAVDGDIIVVGAYKEDSSATNINNDDGHPTVAESNNSATDSGAVYVFSR